MSKSRKQITFDLDTHAMQEYYPSRNWNYGYEIIKRNMEQNGFVWLQGSVYVSQKPMSNFQVQNLIRNLVKENPWLNKCMRDCRETNIGREHDLNHMFDKDMELTTKEELKSQKGTDKPTSASAHRRRGR